MPIQRPTRSWIIKSERGTELVEIRPDPVSPKYLGICFPVAGTASVYLHVSEVKDLIVALQEAVEEIGGNR